MSWRGRLAFTFVLVSVALGLGLATFAGAAPLPPPNKLGQYSPFKLPDGPPKGMGPSIIDAVYRATGGPGTPGNDSLFVIFSEDVDPTSIALADFNFNGGLAAGDVGGLAGPAFFRVDRNLVVLSGFTTGYAAGDSVQLFAREVVSGLDTSVSDDVSLIAIRTGPAIWRAEIRNGADPGDILSNRPAGDTLRVYFTHEISGGLDGANARSDFAMPEFGTGTANLTSVLRGGTGFFNKVVDIIFTNQDAPTIDSHGKVLAEVSDIRLLTGALNGDFGAGDPTDEPSTAAPWHLLDATVFPGTNVEMGPYIIRAGYNDRGTPADSSDDVLTMVFSDDIDPSTTDNLDFFVNNPPTSVPVLGSDDGDHVLTLTDFTGAPAPPTTVFVAGAGGGVTDHQGNLIMVTDSAPVFMSPIIVHARYLDGGDSDPATDLLEIYFDEAVVGSGVDTTSFDYYGFTHTGLVVTDNTDNDSLLTLTGFTAGNPWERGDRIGIRAGSPAPIVGAGAVGVGGNNSLAASETGIDASRLVRDYSAPRQIHYTLNATYFRDSQSGGGADTAFYAFNEIDFDDSDYIVVFTRKNVAVDMQYVQTYLNNAVFIANPGPGSDGGAALDRNIITTYIITPGIGLYSDGQVILPDPNVPETVNFGILAVDADGNVALNTTSNLFTGTLNPGDVQAPRDHNCVDNIAVPGTTTDSDMIHIIGDRNPEEHFIFGDAGSAIGADSIRVYDDAGLTVLLGSGPADPVAGDFALFSIGQPTGDFVYVVAVEVLGPITSESAATPIINDVLLTDNLYPATFRDPLNVMHKYSPGDTVRVLGAAADTNSFQDAIVNPFMTFKSDLLALSADFRGFSTRAGSDSVVFISLGANQNDEDYDWIDDGLTSFNNQALAANGNKDYPEPYVDENGNGQFDCGETFVDYNGGVYSAAIYDHGDSNLDSNDPQEHGWYYVEYWIDPDDATLVADPDGGDNFAVLEDVNIPIRILDNAILSQGSLDLLSADVDGAPVRTRMAFTTDLSLDHLSNPATDSAFVATLDALAPTVSEISYLETSTSLTDPTSYPSGNLITPGDNVYELPSGVATPFVNFVDSTLSDDDVIFVATQLDTTADSEDGTGWRYLSLDPSGDRGTPAHNDGLPGIPLLDDDYDSTTAKSNGLDDDEDGAVDEDGEGVDNSDGEVTDAMQADLAADAAATAPDGVHRGNDGIDNDNDAFFRYNAFIGANVWFNVDESTTNLADDDGDGTADEADEVENYNAAFDDDEDGLQDGSVVAFAMGGNNITNTQLVTGLGPQTIWVKAFEDPAVLARYRGSKNTTPVQTGVGVTPPSWFESYIDKTSDVIGNVSTGFAQRAGKDDFGGVTFSWGARNIVSTATGFPVPLRSGPGDNAFAWNFQTQTTRNLDMSRIQALYDLVDGGEYRLRAVAVDEAYNHNPDWAVPVRFTLDSTAPMVCIPPAQESGTPGTGAPPEFDGFVDIRPEIPGLQIADQGGHPGPYTLRADPIGDGSDIAEVHFQWWDGLAWVDLGVDTSFPYTFNWDAPLISNMPPADADTFFFRAYAVDHHGNTEDQFLLTDDPTDVNGPTTADCIDDGRVWELSVIVIDTTPPSSCLCQIGSDYNLADGAQVPVEQAVDVSACFTDGDGDPNTMDVIHVYFEYTPIGQNAWIPFASLTGVPADGFLRDPSGIEHPLIPTGPDTLVATVTWDTRDLEAGSYEIRAVAVDIEGNTSVITACVITITLDDSPLRAYIQPVAVGGNTLDTCGVAAVDTLFAQVFIHDRSVAVVEFQYYADDNGNGVADDAGSWITIGVQGDDALERKGDVTLRAGTAPFRRVPGGFRYDPNGQTYRYWDADNNGYSSIDPVIQSGDLSYDGGDNVIYPGNGLPAFGATLTTFEADEYFVEINGTGSPENYIMQDNPLNAGGGLDVWMTTWDVTGLNGNYLVRAVATDNLGNTDSDLPGSPIPVAQLDVDSDVPSATITEITLPDGTVIDSLDINPGQYISAGYSWFMVTATPDSGVTDIDKVLFEWSSNGGGTWNILDVNDDNDYYSDLNGNCQFDEGIDEIFVDVDSSGTFSDGDIILSKGDNGVLDTPTTGEFAGLLPLVGEDENDGDDNDGDGKTDEDDSDEPSVLGGQSPEDGNEPYTVPFMFCELSFATETNVLFRATASDSSGNVDCDPEMVSVVVGDNAAPLTDVVVAVINGDSLDIETVLRGTLNPLCLDSTTLGPMYLLVTAEDQAEILGIDIYYRVAPSSLPGFDPNAPDLTPWIAAGLTDNAYPYEFVWDITTLEDGTYEFFARAEDANGNFTNPPTNPYRFSIQHNTATIASAVFLGSNLPVSAAAIGDVILLTAEVDSVDAEGQVCFYYAERIEDEEVTGISTTFPYMSEPLVESIWNDGNGEEVVTIGGQPGIFIDQDDFASFPGKTSLHYTVRNSDRLEFGAALAPGTEVLISYNIGPFQSIACDTDPPYTTEFTVPEPEDSDATHFDLVAAFAGDATCEESLTSEGLSIRILDTEGVEFTIHGIDDIDNNGDIDLNDNMPGNALCVSQGLGFDNDSPVGTQINKLSSDWAEFFVTTEESDVDSVWLVVWHTFDGADSDTCVMTENPLEADPPQPVHKTLHVSDFPTLDPARVENVTISVSGYPQAPVSRTFQMYDDGATGDDIAAGDGVYTALLELPPGATYEYSFKIDLVGADFIQTGDPRHNESMIQIPAVPYWWCSTRLDNDSLFVDNAVNHVHVIVQDDEGNITTNLHPDNQGQIDVIIDRIAPTVDTLRVDRNVVSPNGELQVFASISDPVPADINIITVTEVMFQVSPDASHTVWLEWFTDTDPSNGWGGLQDWNFNPLDDNIDNDLDGTFDETDEGNFVYQIRAVAVDDCHNHGYSDPSGVATVTVDANPPACMIASPENGDIFAHGDVITISSEPMTDTDVLYVSFQYNVGDGWVAIDATPGDDTDDRDGFEGDETPAEAGEGGAFSVTWNTGFLDDTDMYVRLRCVARDIAGNFSGNLEGPFGEPGDPAIEYITILLNDQTAPFAALTEVLGSGLAFCTKSIVDPTLAISDQVQFIGIASGGIDGDVATVVVQYSLNGTTWIDAGVTNALVPTGNGNQEQFAITIDTRALNLPDGDVWFRVLAVDHDGNTQSTGTAVRVRVDNSEPAMWITQVGPVIGDVPVPDGTLIQYDLWPAELARGGQFECDDCARRLDSGLTFRAADPNDGSVDVIDFVFLQFLDDWSTEARRENPVWVPSFPTIPAMDADGNGIVDQGELEDWMENSDDYCDTIEDFLEENSDWKFSYRDLAGNNAPPGAPQDGNWYLNLPGNCEVSGIALLKEMMGEDLPDREYRFRALAVDYAGNANTGYQGHVLRIDATNPTVVSIFAGDFEFEGGGGGGDQSTDNSVKVAGGDVVPLCALVIDSYPWEDNRIEKDDAPAWRGGLSPKGGPEPPDGELENNESQSSGILGVQFQYQSQVDAEEGIWHIIGLGTLNEETGLWCIDWTTPANIPHTGGGGSPTTDSLYTIRAVAVDSAGNCDTGIAEDAVEVQDVTPPDDTEIVDIEGECTDPANPTEETVRGLAGTTVSGIVTLRAATQYGDASMLPNNSNNDDVFEPTVFFEARPVGSTGEWLMICSSQDPVGGGVINDKAQGQLTPNGDGPPQPDFAHEGPVWSCVWDTEMLNGDGDRIWPDGSYTVRAWARDAWGNTELLTDDHMTATVHVDNEAPEIWVDANPGNGNDNNRDTRDIEATVERNDCEGFTFAAFTGTNTEDLVVQFWYKLSTDLNVPGAWKIVSPGLNSEADFNPDTNRPFSYTWDINSIADCDGDLVPGTSIDIVASASDLVCNELSAVAAHQAGNGIRVNIVDTVAPEATITELVRTCEGTSIKFPDNIRVSSFSLLQATILGSQGNESQGLNCESPRDVQSVQFWYTPRTGDTAPAFPGGWILADGDVSPVGADTWQLSNWTSDGLAEGSYWFVAVAEDCFGNSDTTPAAITIIVDTTCPQFVGVNPSNDERVVPEITSQNGPRVIDLIVQLAEGADNDVEYTTVFDNEIYFQYKPSEAADLEENWITISDGVLRHGGTGTGTGQRPTYSAAINIRNLFNEHNICANQSGLYDFRVVARDEACNECATVFANRVVVDNTPPSVEISHIRFRNQVEADDDTLDFTLQPVQAGMLPDISAGDQVELFVTAEDDEPCIPNSNETPVFEVQFYLGDGPNGSGTYPQNLGVAGFNPETGLWSILWNTTGLIDGDYEIYAVGQDEARNITYSQTVTGNVTNPAKPLAQVVAFNPDLLSEITKGSETRIYGLTFGEKLASTMFFQYYTGTGSPASSEWVNIGAATNTGEVLASRDAGLLPQSLWFSNMRVSDFPDGTVFNFRAVAVASSTLDPLGFGASVTGEPASTTETEFYGRMNTGRGFETMDGDPGDFSGLYDLANTPILRMVKSTNEVGQAVLTQDDANDMVDELITSVTSHAVDFSSNGLVTVTTSNPLVTPFVVLVAEDNAGAIDEAIPEMNRRIDNNLVWTGDILGDVNNFTNVNPTEGARIGLFASASLKRASDTAPFPWTDMDSKIWHIWQVTPNAGSNGWAGVDGNGMMTPVPAECATDNVFPDAYPNDSLAVFIPPGAFDFNVGMLLERVYTPSTPVNQDRYISTLGTSFSIRFLDSDWDEVNWAASGEGWLARACFRYDDTDGDIRFEREITVRRWNGSEWTASGVSHVVVDSCANVVCFDFDPEIIGSDNLIFSIVAADRFSPMQADVWPYCNGFTDQDPIFKMILTNIHGGGIDPGNIFVRVDNRLVASTRYFDAARESTKPASTNSVAGGGSTWVSDEGAWMDFEQVDRDGNIWELTFGWSCEDQFALEDGTHELEVTFSDFAESEMFGEGEPFMFEVDKTPPTIVFNGGFIGNPVMGTSPAYVALGDGADQLTVTIIDEGSGVLFREDRIDDDDYSHWWWWDIEDMCSIARYGLIFDSWFWENGIPIQFDQDNSFKYDLWHVDGEDDQDTVDEYEERHLLHTGTADELWANVTELDSVQIGGIWYYSRSAETLEEQEDETKRWNVNILNVPIHIVGGGAIGDGDVVEVTLYSNRYETPPINQLNEFLDELYGSYGGDSPWWIDFSTKRVIQYAKSIQDCVHNTGSRFLEQRFIVDSSAPTVEVTSPGVDCDLSDDVTPTTFPTPDGDYTFVAEISDGSGIDPETVEIEISGPECGDDEDSDEVNIEDVDISEDQISFVIPDEELCVGQYRITISGSDNLGNDFTKTCILTVGGTINAVSDIKAYPNPFDPKDSDVTLSFNTEHEANVKVAIYDWNGDQVRTIDAGSLTPGQQSITWGGDAEDGTPLANGVYLVRIEANDGSRTVTEVLKVAIWRE